MLREVAIRPSSGVFENLWEIPMIERDEWFDVVLQQLIDDAVVKVDALGVHQAFPVGNNPWPAKRDARRIQAQLGHQRDVVSVSMIEIACDVAGIARLDHAGGVRKAVPDRLALAVFVPGAFDLIGSASGAPQKIFWKSYRFRCHRRAVNHTRIMLG